MVLQEVPSFLIGKSSHQTRKLVRSLSRMEYKAVCLLLAFAHFALGKTDQSPFVLLSPEMVNEINSLNAGYDSFFF